VLANVAGTRAAETAALDAAIPQTARVDRKSASIDVEYDGEPYFTHIRGTSLELAENANVTVIRESNGNYFALDNGIWFISDDPYGPWAVANDRPRDIDRIPASSAAYSSRYVHIYDVYPDYVYMGYTPGYLGSYVYGPTVVYGTGYYYRPWFRRVYYPRPVTWGFGFMYDPWWGWNFNFGYNFGYSYVGLWYDHPAYYGWGWGWFGPYRHCPSYRNPYWGGGYYGRGDYYYGRSRYDNRNYYGSASRRDRPYYGSGQPSGRTPRFGNNLYTDQRGVSTRNITRAARVYRPGEQNSSALSPRVNTRYSDRLNQRPQQPRDNNSTPNASPARPDRRGNLNTGDDARNPVLTRPGNATGDNDNFRNRYNNQRRPGEAQTNPGQDNDQQVNESGEGRQLPRVYSPRGGNSPRVENDNQERSPRPALENRQQERSQRSNSDNRPVERMQRSSYERPSEPQRRVESPSFERPAQPQRSVERPSFERPSQPQRSVERPSLQRPSSGGGSSPAVRPSVGSRPQR
jgi:hypothetical protein